jgi:hypothetical protein
VCEINTLCRVLRAVPLESERSIGRRAFVLIENPVCLALLEKDVIPECEVSVGGGRWHAAEVYIVVAVRRGWSWTVAM